MGRLTPFERLHMALEGELPPPHRLAEARALPRVDASPADPAAESLRAFERLHAALPPVPGSPTRYANDM